ncbi:putative Polyketide synthase [Seiridium cardinale]
MFQITGVARTAHAWNNGLRFVTVHVDPGVLESWRLAGQVLHWLGYMTNRSGVPHHEGEYRVSKTAAVLVPRLHGIDQLNRAITSQERIECRQFEARPFAGDTHPAPLCHKEKSSEPDDFVVGIQAVELAEDAIEIDTHGFVLSKPDDLTAPPIGEFAGNVRRVGKAVRNFAPGESVVAISLGGV